jgi:hypothetical protein
VLHQTANQPGIRRFRNFISKAIEYAVFFGNLLSVRTTTKLHLTTRSPSGLFLRLADPRTQSVGGKPGDRPVTEP